MTLEDQMAALRPTDDNDVIDLVAAAGIDVSGWAVTESGKAVDTPGSNPAYCFDWAFGARDEPRVVFVWFQDLSIFQGRIAYSDNLRAHANQLLSWSKDRSRDRAFRHRAGQQYPRADRFDAAIQRSWRMSQPVRVILLVGSLSTEVQSGDRSASVKFRRLDDAEWHVESYDDDGNFVLVRSQAYAIAAATPVLDVLEVCADVEAAAEADDVIDDDLGSEQFEQRQPTTFDGDQRLAIEPEPWIDQFTLLDTPERREALTNSYERKPEVRIYALRRARGCCELCGAEGFRTEQGVYLETHHVIPLSEGGPDHPSNVMALCANDHRRAHFSAERDSIRQQLLATLAVMNASSSGG